MKKRFLITALIIAILIPMALVTPIMAQVPSGLILSCHPLTDPLIQGKIIECELSQTDDATFMMAEITFPFPVSSLHHVSSSYASVVGYHYQTQDLVNTITIMAVNHGDEDDVPQMQSIPFDNLVFRIETFQFVSQLKSSFEATNTVISYLAPNPNDPGHPSFHIADVFQEMLIDNTMIYDAFARRSSQIGVLEFIRLGLACYEKTPTACFENLLDSL